MLTRELAIYEIRGNSVRPDRLVRKPGSPYPGYAAAMAGLYREGIGKRRGELHAAVRRLFAEEPACPPQRIEAFCKLLEEPGIASFDSDRRGKSPALRKRVFERAAPLHPLVDRKDGLFDHPEAEAKAAIAAELGFADWAAVEADLFADVFENQRLAAFTGYDPPEALLSRYNVAQVQAALFDAVRLTIRARADFKRIVTQAKLARLLHDIVPPASPGGAYTLILDGPASVLRETRRYGVQMAAFLPAVIACRDWSLEAEVRVGRLRRSRRLTLSSEDGLKAAMPAADAFDSSVEENFARKWGEARREGWLMKRESEILQKRQVAMVPDFAFYHEDGRVALLEIVGFWTPEYLRHKTEKLKVFEDRRILLAVAQGTARRWAEMPAGAIPFKTALKVADVLAALNNVAPPGRGSF